MGFKGKPGNYASQRPNSNLQPPFSLLYCPTVIAAQKARVVIGMSGGVDSSTAAALLVEQGYDVIGVTLKLWKQDCFSPAQDLFKCCGSRAAADVRTVCDGLGIPFHLVD